MVEVKKKPAGLKHNRKHRRRRRRGKVELGHCRVSTVDHFLLHFS